MDKQIDTKLQEEQAGFRAGRGCFDQIFTHRTVIEQSAEENHRRQKRGLQWGLMGHLEDLDYADELALISETIKHLQNKTNRLVKYGGQVGLLVNVQRTEILANTNQNITINDQQLKQNNKFTYLGSVISSEDGSKADIKSKIDRLGLLSTVYKIIGCRRNLP